MTLTSLSPVHRRAGLPALLAATLLVIGPLPGAGAFQLEAQLRVSSDPDARGWIGISFDVTREGWGRRATVVVTDVVAGSPAEEAGIRRGDRILAINDLDRPEDLEELGERLRLRVGDRVTVRIEREGESSRLRLRAAERPADFEASERIEFTFQTDAMVDTWVRSMDSLRVELVQGAGREGIRVQRAPQARGGRITVVTENGGRGVRAPFEFFVFRGEEQDSMREELSQLGEVMAGLRSRLARREGQLRREGHERGERRHAEDRELRRIRAELDEARLRSTSIESAMAEAARATGGLEYVLAPGVASSVSPAAPEARADFRPMTPYLMGRNRVAGAEVVDLRQELAEYFDVQGGVLVVDVAPRTPAAIAGILPGDVITRIDQVGVRTVEDLRFGVSMAGDTLPITVIRKGTSVQVLLRR